MKKGVSWSNDDYLSKVKLQDIRGRQCQLERKSSLGPCFRAAAPFGRPSGIALSLKRPITEEDNDIYYIPKKSIINISLSRRCLVNKTVYWDIKECVSNQISEDQVKPKLHLLGTLKDKISMVTSKIKNIF